MQTRMLYVHALSGIHSGTGQATGVIDLPVAREIVTNWPYLPGSTLKGVLRDLCEPDEDTGRQTFDLAFGQGGGEALDNAAALWFSDARLLCFPTRSLYGTLAWVSCPLALERWRRDALDTAAGERAPIPTPASDNALVTPGSALANGGAVFLAEFDLPASETEELAALAREIADAALDSEEWRALFVERFALVSDDLFSYLTETGTDVSARIRLQDDTKTVERGGLWYEEAVPAEAIFSAPVTAAPRAGQVAEAGLFDVLAPALAQPVQIGGNASIGRGLTRLRLTEMAS